MVGETVILAVVAELTPSVQLILLVPVNVALNFLHKSWYQLLRNRLAMKLNMYQLARVF